MPRVPILQWSLIFASSSQSEDVQQEANTRMFKKTVMLFLVVLILLILLGLDLRHLTLIWFPRLLESISTPVPYVSPGPYLLEYPYEYHFIINEPKKCEEQKPSLDFLDCYKNLTIKTMVMLEWLDSYCSSASYAMKIDSDVSKCAQTHQHVVKRSKDKLHDWTCGERSCSPERSQI